MPSELVIISILATARLT